MSNSEQTGALCECNIKSMSPETVDSTPLDISAESLLEIANLRYFLRSRNVDSLPTPDGGAVKSEQHSGVSCRIVIVPGYSYEKAEV